MEWIQWSKKRLYTIREIWWIVLSFILTICTLINLTLTLLKKKKKYKHLYLLHKLFFSMNVLFHFWASARMWLAKWSSCPAISCNGAATHLPLRTVFFFIFNFFGLLSQLFFFCLQLVVHLSWQFTFSFFNHYRYQEALNLYLFPRG